MQGAAGTGLLNAVVATRVGADLIATAVYPLALTLHRVAGQSLVEALHGLGRQTGVDVGPLWEASDIVDEHIGDEPVAPVAPRIAVRAAEYDLPAGIVAALDIHLRANAAGDRLLDTLSELQRIRAEAGWPPLASPIGQILGSQAMLNVLSARRYGTLHEKFRQLVEGAYGATPAPIEESLQSLVDALPRTTTVLEDDAPSTEDVLEAAGRSRGLRGGPRPSGALRRAGGDAPEDDPPAPHRRGVAARRRRRGRALGPHPGDREDRAGIGRGGDRDRGRGHARLRPPRGRAGDRSRADGRDRDAADAAAGAVASDGVVRVTSPMVGVFYRSANPGSPPFVEVGDPVGVGQTLCLLEAMKLFNELKSEVAGRLRAVHVDNAQPVEYETLLFEIEPVAGPPAV